MRFLHIVGSFLLCPLGKSIRIFNLHAANTFLKISIIDFQSSCSIDFVPVVRSAPKKYLVETEDGGVEDTGLGPKFEKDAKKLDKLNEKALSEGLSENQEEEAKEILDNNEELAELVVEYGSKPKSDNKFWGFLGGLAKQALPVLGGLAKSVAPVILDFAKGALKGLLLSQVGGGGGGAPPPPTGGGGGGDEEYYGYGPENRDWGVGTL